MSLNNYNYNLTKKNKKRPSQDGPFLFFIHNTQKYSYYYTP